MCEKRLALLWYGKVGMKSEGDGIKNRAETSPKPDGDSCPCERLKNLPEEEEESKLDEAYSNCIKELLQNSKLHSCQRLIKILGREYTCKKNVAIDDLQYTNIPLIDSVIGCFDAFRISSLTKLRESWRSLTQNTEHIKPYREQLCKISLSLTIATEEAYESNGTGHYQSGLG